MDILQLVIRLAIAFITLMILTRLMGRKEITQMTFFNFVSGIAIGTIGASLAIDSSLTIRNGIIALLGWSIFTIVVGIVDIKSKTARIFFEGQPLIVVKQGQIMRGNLRKARLNSNMLSALLRQKNVFSIADVDYAIFETSGKLSVMKKETAMPVTKTDMNIQPVSFVYPIPTSVIGDGKINWDNLNKLRLDQNWLDNKLQSAGYESASDVFYAEVQKDGTVVILDKTGISKDVAEK